MSSSAFWILKEPIDAFFLDCDSTLSLIEGIDVLANMNGVAKQVHHITERCMSTTGLSLNDYRKRLDYVQPTKKQLEELAAIYVTHIAPGARETIELLYSLNKKIYVISGGLKIAVSEFAQTLGIPAENILAVDIYFDSKGTYKGFDEQSNLIQPNGKAVEIARVLKPGERSLLVGDGMSDWEAKATVTRFIGYAGLHGKEWLRQHSDMYINSTSFYPIIPLGLTQEEISQLSPKYLAYYEQGLTGINAHVLIKEKDYV